MDITLIKLSLEKLHENMEVLKEDNKLLRERINLLESMNANDSTYSEPSKLDLEGALLNTKEVRRILGISHNTLQAIVRAGKLIQKRINGRSVRYSRRAVREYIESLS